MVEQTLNCIPNANTVPIPDSALDVRRVRWVPAAGLGSPVTLQRGDVLSFQRFTPNYLQSNVNPLRWDIITGQEAPGVVDTLLALILDTLVSVPSTVQALTIAGAPDFNPPGGNPLLIPNDWAWVLKFGALADILSKEEEGKDVARAQYCRKRYDEGLELMITMPWLVQGLLDGVAVDTPCAGIFGSFQLRMAVTSDGLSRNRSRRHRLVRCEPNSYRDSLGGHDGGAECSCTGEHSAGPDLPSAGRDGSGDEGSPALGAFQGRRKRVR